ncbi:MAG: tRNA (adenosine(37)-N6)-threonylcarbamoyltransferase complex dimerization subunit type 1 TsaB [Sphingobacteriales bacterium]|nr:tRNA (adenosine(37)-N6)-threonylcarbamoyltransferase complex dimerization subunit type 1 TsaB [Sphingobacteriales bacterium]
MALILQIETATQTCSVALAQDGVLLAYKEQTERNIHASVITLFIEELMQKADKKFQDLEAIAVSMGPGSYTGLRIGVSTAKGLCYALDIPLIAVNTLEAMSSGFVANHFSVNSQTLFCPMIDARRMEVYCAIFNAETQQIQETKAEIIDEHSFKHLLTSNIIYFFGDGATKCESVLGLHLNARVIDDFENSARHLTRLAHEKFLKNEFEDVAYFEPFYLKDFIAGKKAN